MHLFLGLACLLGMGIAAPTMPESYQVNGTLYLPYAEIAEPFKAYFDTKQNKSRIDYYDLVQTFQLPNASEFGLSLKIAPMTTENITNKRTCFQVNGTSDSPVLVQSILPDISNFSQIGTAKMGGKNCSVWQYSAKIGSKKNVYTIWLNQDDSLPVRYEMMGYDTLLGSHYDKYYVDYASWALVNKTLPSDVFSVPATVRPCGGFPGPGNAHHRRMVNPLREFIHHDDSHVYPMFEEFKAKHGKKYASKEEHLGRLHTFKHNLRYIESQNRRGLSYQLAVNHLADLRDEEMQAMRGFRVTPGYNGGKPFDGKLLTVKIPDQVDWRLYGAVTPVKDQAVCGSCWSFGTTGTVEGAHFLKTGELVRLSQQALIDCSWGEGNNACDGGEDFRAYQWIMKHGLPSEEDYGPYLGQDGECHVNNAKPTAKLLGYVNVTNTTQALKAAIAVKGPVSVAIDASHKSLSFYSNGVYYEPECGNTPDDLDHAVLAVGYGYQNGEGYWLIKNSWSTYWGNDGYVLMAQRDNNCGVTTAATYVIM